MAQTLVSLMVHVIFSTKNRERLITREIEPELFTYLGGILKNNVHFCAEGGIGRGVLGFDLHDLKLVFWPQLNAINLDGSVGREVFTLKGNGEFHWLLLALGVSRQRIGGDQQLLNDRAGQSHDFPTEVSCGANAHQV